mmetsp:Transcript_12224/g.31160  ORF Transcript_12224/g.31160 Transcript_12224/m.31160 type:complete len:200 (+) Transcript_12224:57-656(+)
MCPQDRMDVELLATNREIAQILQPGELTQTALQSRSEHALGPCHSHAGRLRTRSTSVGSATTAARFFSTLFVFECSSLEDALRERYSLRRAAFFHFWYSFWLLAFRSSSFFSCSIFCKRSVRRCSRIRLAFSFAQRRNSCSDFRCRAFSADSRSSSASFSDLMCVQPARPRAFSSNSARNASNTCSSSSCNPCWRLPSA